jgi:hypothetical protein
MLRVLDVVSIIGPLTCLVALTSCTKPAQIEASRAPPARSREVVITTVPLLTKELAATYPFLNKDFATNGVLDGKEVYEFMPSTITVGGGDVVLRPQDGSTP